MALYALSLQSGSNGNCVFVDADGVRLLVDAGISGKQTQLRLASHGIDIRTIQGILISHEHTDHVACAHVLQKKFGLPLYVTTKTWSAVKRCRPVAPNGVVHVFSAGDTLKIGGVRVETIPTPHDAVDGVAFVVDTGKRRLGVLTDLGHVFDGLGSAVASLDGVFLESNYDPEMLAAGGYPLWLQRRIEGPAGHLSNRESAELLREHGRKRLAWACLAHLSENNNTPDRALATHRGKGGHRVALHLARRDGATDVFEL
jgi:phosphoribosyl 1,2-cyclic phosphodiesterase